MPLYFCLYFALVRASSGFLRVYQGSEDILNEFPSIVALYRDADRFGTGSLISETWVITAGHCLQDAKEDQILVRYSDLMATPNKTKSHVKPIKTYIHPSYRVYDDVIMNDIGLILTKAVNEAKPFGKLSAVDSYGLIGLPAKYAGFGYAGTLGKLIAKVSTNKPLLMGEGVITSCPPRKSSSGPAICVAPKCSNRNQMAVNGDSGGPLVYNKKIIGVVSGYSAKFKSISFFTPVGPHLQWIRMVMFANITK